MKNILNIAIEKSFWICESFYKKDSFQPPKDTLNFLKPMFFIFTLLISTTFFIDKSFVSFFFFLLTVFHSVLVIKLYFLLDFVYIGNRDDIKDVVKVFNSLTRRELKLSYIGFVQEYNFNRELSTISLFLKTSPLKDKNIQDFCHEDNYANPYRILFFKLEKELNLNGFSLFNGISEKLSAHEQLLRIRKEKARLIMTEKELLSRIYSGNPPEFSNVKNEPTPNVNIEMKNF